MGVVNDQLPQQQLENEVAALESRLAEAKQRLKKSKAANNCPNDPNGDGDDGQDDTDNHNRPHAQPRHNPLDEAAFATDSSHHYLLLLSDSALPLGSFAFSSGLESYLAHHGRGRHGHRPSFSSFLPLSLSSYAGAALPFVLAAHRDPRASALAALDDALDAAVVCTVGRRASVAQGRALLSIWEKSLAPGCGCGSGAADALAPFAALLRSAPSSSSSCPPDDDDGGGGGDSPLPPPVSAHLPPLFGAVSALLGLTARQAAYVFLLAHAKALASAAVRAGCFGPYQAQRVLAGGALRDAVAAAVAREWRTPPEEAGQRVPAMDLWVGRHELLYSRIFNS